MNTGISKVILVGSVLLIAALSNSCSKKTSTDLNAPNDHKTIAGEWKWISSVAGWGDTKMPSADSIVILKLNNDSSYLVSVNDHIRYSGNFSSTIIPAQDSLIVIQFDQNIEADNLKMQKTQSVVYFNNDTCRLYDHHIADGYSHLYYRK